MSSMRRIYSSSSSATHHIFFPPRLQIMCPQQDADRLPSHLRHQLSLYRFLSNEPHAPSCLPRRWRTTHQGDNPLTLAGIQSPLLAGAWLLIQGRLQPLFLIAPSDGAHLPDDCTTIYDNLYQSLYPVQLAQDKSPQKHPRRFPP